MLVILSILVPINGDSAITMTVDKLAKDSQYQRLIQLVKQADSTPLILSEWLTVMPFHLLGSPL